MKEHLNVKEQTFDRSIKGDKMIEKIIHAVDPNNVIRQGEREMFRDIIEQESERENWRTYKL